MNGGERGGGGCTHENVVLAIEAANRKDYFYTIHNEMMKRQLQRDLDKAVIESSRK